MVIPFWRGVNGSGPSMSQDGAWDALSGYQKGHWFYCFRSFSLLGPEPPDVDHFFPHSLKAVGMVAVDGVRNLVLSCPRCNRGAGGKSNRVPTLKLPDRLLKLCVHHEPRPRLPVQRDPQGSR
jgi:5-methylcytosine-specific restriction endonuclease McrA